MGLGVVILALDYAVDPYGHSAEITLAYFLLEHAVIMVGLFVCATVLGRVNSTVAPPSGVVVTVVKPVEFVLSRMAFSVRVVLPLATVVDVE